MCVGLWKLQLSLSWTWDRASAEREPEEERLPEGGTAPCAGLFLKNLSPPLFFFFFATGEGELWVFTRRNDASQPRLHPAPPQRNRLFGKKKKKSQSQSFSFFSFHMTQVLFCARETKKKKKNNFQTRSGQRWCGQMFCGWSR